MKDWLLQNTDKLLLFVLVLLGGAMMVHILHHGAADNTLMNWLENAFMTVLGALILLLTGHKKDGPPEVPKP